MNEREKLLSLFTHYEDLEDFVDFVLADRKRIIDEAMNSALNMVPYLLFDTSPNGIKVYAKSLRQSIEQRVANLSDKGREKE